MTVLKVVTAEPLADPALSVVGVGAGEGGLEAFEQMLQALPPDTGMAFVFVQHKESTDVDTRSAILTRTSAMPVVQVRGERSLEPNHVYIVPSAHDVVIEAGVLKVLPCDEGAPTSAPVDCFLQSLAKTHRDRAIGILLSGTGHDGTSGLEAIRAGGGFTFAQDESARHDGMSRSAIAAGCVDFILSPCRMAQELKCLSQPREKVLADAPRDSTRIDLYRKITRRMVLNEVEGPPEYTRLLRRETQEAKAFHQDIRLADTSFFRDAGAFDVLSAKVFPALVQNRTGNEPLRVWVPGCSTGEEVYSLAIALKESVADESVPIRVFATDVDEEAIQEARAGRYPKTVSEYVSPERLRRFFVETRDEYQIAKSVRDMCVFAGQNVLTDPPFSRIDLIACRTLLLSLDPFLQRRVLPLLHHALRPSGFLVLGRSGTIGALADLFETVDARYRIYSRKGVAAPTLALPLSASARERLGRPRPPGSNGGGVDAQHEADRLVLANYARPGVLVNADLEVLQFRGDTRRYLTPPPGKPTTNLLRMARKGLLVGLRAAVQKALQSGGAVREEGFRINTNGVRHEVDLEVVPIRTGTASEVSLLVMFEERKPPRGRATRTTSRIETPKLKNRQEDQRQVARLMREVAATRDYLQSVINELEATNDALQYANEEILSTNRELQSINEELQASRDEIQSSNDQLSRLIEEVGRRNQLLGQVNSDLANFLASAHLPLVMVDSDLRVRRFTSRAATLLNLAAADEGKPIRDLILPLAVRDLDVWLTEVVDSVVVQEHEVQDNEGRWYSLRLSPYRSADNTVDGAVMMLVDIDAQKRIQGAIEESEQRFRLLADDAPVFIWLDGIGGREFVNRTYLEYLGVGEPDVRGWNFIRFMHPDDRDSYVVVRDEVSSRRDPFEMKFRLRRADGEYRWMMTTGVPRLTECGELLGYAGSTHDIDDLVRAQDALARSEQSLATELAAMRRLQEVSSRLVQAGDTDSLMKEILDAAIAITAADMGNIQLRDRSSDTLRIVASRGFKKPFLEFFAEVRDDRTACGAAMQCGQRVIVEDVTRSEIYTGRPALDVMLAAGVRGVQSTPLISRSGVQVGMLSTHCRTPMQPADRDLRVLDLLARQAADAIERIQIEEARLEAASRSQQLLDVIPAGVYAVGSTGVVTNYNRQAVELWGRAPKPGDTDERLWFPVHEASDSPRPRLSAVKNALRSGTPVRGEEALIERPDGSRIPVHINVDAIRDAAGRISGAIVVFQDVTHLKRAEAALTADHRKDQFVAMLAHELRNPLAALRLTVELMRRDNDVGAAAGDLKLIDQQVSNLARLVDDLLDVTRMRQGKINLLKVPIDLRTVVESAIQSIKPDVDSKGLALSVELPRECVYVDGDAARLEQAVVNLLDNAMKYTDTGGRIGVALTADPAQAVLRVQDTGIGIRPEMLPCIFDLFSQDESSLTRSRGGLGIGLFMVAKLAEMHDGGVEAHSEGLGQGAGFSIHLPRLSPRQLRRLRAKQAGAEAAPTLPALRILLVEDNVDVADKLAALLRRDGHEVRLERDGAAAVVAVSAFQPSAVLLDIGLPLMDGYQVARQIRQQPGFENVVIVGLSGYTHEEAQRRSVEAGFDELLGKPFDLNVLGAKLARLVVGEN